jgi:gluconolactonase
MIETPADVTILAEGLPHAEGLAFDSEGGLYTGIAEPDHVGQGPLIHISPDGSERRVVADTGGRILGIATDASDRAYVCDSRLGAVFRIDPGGEITLVTQGAPGHDLRMPNFCVFDPDGVLYISDSGTATAGEATGAVLRHTPDGRTEVLVDGLVFANGLAHDPATNALYVVETRDDRVRRIDLDQSSPSAELYIDGLSTGPDGIALDREGVLHVTLTRTHAIVEATDRGTRTVATDPGGTWLNMPSNLAFRPDGSTDAVVANLFGSHLTVIRTERGGDRPTQGPAV